MSEKRDNILQQLGITQWVLHRPAVLRGESALNIAETVRLLIVADPPPDLRDPRLCDILRSMGLVAQQALILRPAQVARLPEATQCTSWRLGISEPLSLPGVQLHSPPLAELSKNTPAKRALWQQMWRI